MSRLTLTAKEQKRKREQMIKIIITLVVLTIITGIAIYWVLTKDSNQEKNGVIDDEVLNLSTSEQSGEKMKIEEKEGKTTTMKTNNKYVNVDKNPIVTMEMEDGREVKIELYPQIAPTTVENFISLIQKGFYDGLYFHRVMPEFMAQGGDPSGDGTGGPGYSIYGEFSENGFENNLKHDVGVISMARATEPDSAGSQFFIVTNDLSYLSLDGKYAGFGKVVEGMDVVMDIVNSETVRKEYSENLQKLMNEGGQIDSMELYLQYMQETAEMARPKNPPVIKKMTVDTYGFTYDEPEKIEK